MPSHDIIAIGASAGRVAALSMLVRDLPSDLPAALFVVQHVPAQSSGNLAILLNRAKPLLAVAARDYEPIEYGRIYIAPPDYHMVLIPGGVRVVHGRKENLSRPAIDPMFRTAAQVYGPRVVGVVLTGCLVDGTAGLVTIKSRGGTAIIQDPADADFPFMPRSAMKHVDADHVLPLGEIPRVLISLVHATVREDERA